MLAKFSVKRPFTIVVAVILVLILGAVAYTNMGVDLLPEIELPYVVVMTTYGGASPESVEQNVTQPLESALASLSGVETLASVSSENVSLLLIQFNQGMNMDSAMIELSSYIDIVESMFPEGVAAPVVLRINPSMMPVMVASADKDGLDEAAFSEYVENDLVPAFERVPGVASVDAMGLIVRQVEITWDEAAIDHLNDRLLAAVDSELAEAKAELDKARREINDGQAELEEKSEEAYQELAEAAGELNNGRLQLQLGQNALDAAPDQIEAARDELESTRESLEGLLDMFDAYDEVEDGLEQVEEGLEQIEKAEDAIFYQFGSYAGAEAAMDQAYDGMEAARDDLQDAYDQLQTAGMALATAGAAAQADPSLENQAAFAEAQAAFDSAQADLIAAMGAAGAALAPLADLAELGSAIGGDSGDGFGGGMGGGIDLDPSALSTPEGMLTALDAAMDGVEEFQDQLGELRNGKKEAEAAQLQLILAKNQLDMVMAQAGDMDRRDVRDAIGEIDDGLIEIDEALADLPEQQQELDEAKEELTEGEVELEKGKMTLSTELSSAAVQLALGEAQLDAAFEEFEKARDEALENAGLEGALTTEMLSGILTASNFAMPAGYLDEEGETTLVKVGDKFAGLDELKQLLLFDLKPGDIGPVLVEDVATVVLNDNSGEYYAKINGNPGVILSMSKQSMYSTAEVSASINEVMEQLQEDDPGLHLAALSDQGYYIRTAVASVIGSLLEGAVLAIIVLILFLRSLRPTLVIAFSIPISLLFAITLMYFSGVNINVISLAGLAIGVGMLVDNSIVVIENIYRLRALGVKPASAAVAGARQMSGAITASTLTTVCVFLPIVFTQGLSRQLFVDMGLTVGYSLIASLLVALTLVPTLAATVLIKPPPVPGRLHTAVINGYGRLISLALNHKALVFIPILAIAIGVSVAVVSMGTSFIPQAYYGQMAVQVSAPEDEILSNEQVQALADQVCAAILTIEDVETVGAFEGDALGLSALTGDDQYSVTLYVLFDLESELNGDQAYARITEQTAAIPAHISVINASFDLSALSGSGVEVVLKGDDLDVLSQLATDCAALLAQVEGLTDIDPGLDDLDQELRVTVDKNAAMRHGLTVAQVFTALAGELKTETSSITISDQGQEYPVKIINAPSDALDRESLPNYSFEVEEQDDEGETVKKKIPLASIAEIRQAEGFAAIAHIDQLRTHSVTAAVDAEHNIGLVSREVESKLAELELPEGYRLDISGENESIEEAMEDLILMILLACAFIYLIMVAQFQSLLLPFIVMFTIPLAFSGGLLALIITGNEISIISMLGFLILAGVIVNNGIVFVDCVNQLRIDEGLPKREALITAGQMRLRPILMTALTTIFALVSMAFSQEMGAELLRPLAIVAIGGLTYATALTLVFVPALYDVLQRRQPRQVEIEDVDL